MPEAQDAATMKQVAKQFHTDLCQQLMEIRKMEQTLFQQHSKEPEPSYGSLQDALSDIAGFLRTAGKSHEAEILDTVSAKITDEPAFGGLGVTKEQIPSEKQYVEALFLSSSWLESLNSHDRAPQNLAVSLPSSESRRPMTLTEKIFTQHCRSSVSSDGLSAGDVVRVGVDWILASELSWAGMAKTYEDMGSPGIWRNDRFWLAGDHVVHPTITHVPKIKTFIDKAEEAKRKFKMTEYQGMNYTIMHTEFVRERAEPGMLCLGSDSHTCSAGAVGCLAIGLGTADVMMTLALGETWFKIPDAILIDIKGQPAVGISGKDVILHILKIFKRNTVAAGRIVEFVGEGVKHLSCDARFAISNMCTEFGAITGVFVPDEVTKAYVDKRRKKTYKSSSLYFKPDAGAHYAGHHTIDLSEVEPSVARYPNPDDVVPVSEMAGTKLDGVFIGACTTTEEELVLAALVIQVGLAKGLPLAKGNKHYVPGSLPVVERLRELDLLRVYEAAGFTRGPPGCSFCVGLSAEKAAEGETWLSSQNRNFRNRMGKGSIGHITSAIVCAASAFSMTITSPLELLKEIDMSFFNQYKNDEHTSPGPPQYVEPAPQISLEMSEPPVKESNASNHLSSDDSSSLNTLQTIRSRVVRLGDFIDTDALAPGDTLTTCVTDEDFGNHVLKYQHPDFRDKVRGGQQVVVGGEAFGVGSSREVAVSALKGVGVKAVIAKSFAFIYQRNQPSLGLLGFAIDDEELYELAKDGDDIEVNVSKRTVSVGGKAFPFRLSEIEYNLTVNNGIAESFKKYGKGIWTEMTRSDAQETELEVGNEPGQADERLEW